MNDLGEKMQVLGRGWIMARSVTKARPLRKYKLHPLIHTFALATMVLHVRTGQKR